MDTPVTVTIPDWWPEYDPHVVQQIALFGHRDAADLLYGGAAGGGKSDYLLMAASQFCERPDYVALLLRKTFTDLNQPGGIMNRAVEWWAGQHGIRWHQADKRLTWPSGARVVFGHLDSATAHLRYQGGEYHFIGIDEASQIPAQQLTYLHSRLRRHEGSGIPTRYRLASNPGGVSHDFLRAHYVQDETGERVFLPARMGDNPGVDQADYLARLSRLDSVTRAQLERGDWDVAISTGWLEVDRLVQTPPDDWPDLSGARRVRFWDLAATEEREGEDPDWTVGALLAEHDGLYFLCDVARFRAGPAAVERRIAAVAAADGAGVEVILEQEPGSSGKALVQHYARRVLPGALVRGVRPTGPKIERAKPLASAVANGLLHVPAGALWLYDMMSEWRSFPEGAHDDQVDAVAGAFAVVSKQRPRARIAR